jgi:hypothetical protein
MENEFTANSPRFSANLVTEPVEAILDRSEDVPYNVQALSDVMAGS